MLLCEYTTLSFELNTEGCDDCPICFADMDSRRAPARTGASRAGDAQREAIGGAGDELVRFDHQVAALKAGCRIDDERLERPVRVQSVDLGAWSSQPGAK